MNKCFEIINIKFKTVVSEIENKEDNADGIKVEDECLVFKYFYF